MSPLVEKLSNGRHPVSVTRYKDATDIKEAIARGFVLVKFTETQGGTELGVSLDENVRSVDASSEKLNLCGSLSLDYQPVRCSVEIDLATLTGFGFLEPVHV
jgi:hypothetical protein